MVIFGNRVPVHGDPAIRFPNSTDKNATQGGGFRELKVSETNGKCAF